MEPKDWWLVLSTFLSPAIAVTITLWWQQRKEKRDTKIRLFLTLMAHRKYNTLQFDYLAALNTIDVVFSDASAVIEKWHRLYDLLNNEQVSSAFGHAQISLLSEMAKHLGYRQLEQTDIDKFYLPTGHVDLQNLDVKWKEELIRAIQTQVPPPKQGR